MRQLRPEPAPDEAGPRCALPLTSAPRSPYATAVARDTLTLIDDGRPHEVTAAFADGVVRVAPEDLRTALGWELKPEGLCRGARCIPTRGEEALVTADGIDLARFAALVDRPLALDAAERTAYLGVGAGERAAQLASLEAPDFTLPDLDGRPHALSAYRGKKIFLLAYASW